MKYSLITWISLAVVFFTGCVPIGSIAKHELKSGYYKLNSEKIADTKVYADVYEDSIIIFQLKETDSVKPDLSSGIGSKISSIGPDNDLYGSRFIKKSIEVDLSTILTKLRPVTSAVPAQLNSNLNALVYLGARNDIYKIKTYNSVLNKCNSSVRHFGYDAGIFAGIGIVPVNPTVTNDNTNLEYDGIVFQKGIGVFITTDNASVGLTLGFDNLIGGNSINWIYNNRPYLGLTIGIANF
jgi:hypothetical protein